MYHVLIEHTNIDLGCKYKGQEQIALWAPLYFVSVLRWFASWSFSCVLSQIMQFQLCISWLDEDYTASHSTRQWFWHRTDFPLHSEIVPNEVQLLLSNVIWPPITKFTQSFQCPHILQPLMGYENFDWSERITVLSILGVVYLNTFVGCDGCWWRCLWFVLPVSFECLAWDISSDWLDDGYCVQAVQAVQAIIG